MKFPDRELEVVLQSSMKSPDIMKKERRRQPRKSRSKRSDSIIITPSLVLNDHEIKFRAANFDNQLEFAKIIELLNESRKNSKAYKKLISTEVRGRASKRSYSGCMSMLIVSECRLLAHVSILLSKADSSATVLFASLCPSFVEHAEILSDFALENISKLAERQSWNCVHLADEVPKQIARTLSVEELTQTKIPLFGYRRLEDLIETKIETESALVSKLGLNGTEQLPSEGNHFGSLDSEAFLDLESS